MDGRSARIAGALLWGTFSGLLFGGVGLLICPGLAFLRMLLAALLLGLIVAAGLYARCRLCEECWRRLVSKVDADRQ